MRLSAIGDCVHALPTIDAIRRHYGEQVEVDWAIQRTGAEAVRPFGAADRYHLFPRHSRGWRRLRDLVRFRQGLRSRRFEVAIDLQGNSKSGLVARLSGARRLVGLPLSERRELSRLLVPGAGRAAPGHPSEVRHVIERNLDVLRALDVAPEPPDVPIRQATGRLEQLDGPRAVDVVLCPGTTWPTKIWPRPHFARLARALLAEGRSVELFWGNDTELEWATEIRSLALGTLRGADAARADRRLRLAPKLTLAQLAAYFHAARLVVGNDSGPMHLAAAVGAPAVGLFGATDPRRNGLYWPQTRSLHLEGPDDVDCRPCWSRTCSRGDLACLERLAPERVLHVCAELLERSPSAS